MTKPDQIMAALTARLAEKGVLVETTDNNLTTFIFLSEAETQIRMGGSNQE